MIETEVIDILRLIFAGLYLILSFYLVDSEWDNAKRTSWLIPQWKWNAYGAVIFLAIALAVGFLALVKVLWQ